MDESQTVVLATGAHLKNSAGLSLGGHWWPSAPHGDLGSPEACAALAASLDQLLAQADRAGVALQAVAHDLHPDFHSTRLALALAAQRGVPAIGVQHHLAHIAVTLAEQAIHHGVIGIALDGVGLGSDGTAWGGELLWVHGARWSRVGHLLPLALPGGDRAAREPWRMAAAALHALDRGDQIAPRFAPVVGPTLAQGLQQMLQRQLNCPPSSSAGRWFDAAAAALGLCAARQDEAQAAMALEALATTCTRPVAALPLPIDHGVIDLRPLLAQVFTAADQGRHAEAALCFHLSLATALASAAAMAAEQAGTSTVVLGGGCFFNRVLSQHLASALQARGLQVLRPAASGCGDAGLARGQAWVAQQQRVAATLANKEMSCA